ncbi:MAG: hypothetical protein ABI602_04265 [Candidatus Saccharibacteria bacterium]
MAKSVTTPSKKNTMKPTTTSPTAPPPKTAQSLLITLPILAVVLVAIGYIEQRTATFSTGQRVTTQATESAKATLLISAHSQQSLEPISVSVTEGLIDPAAGSLGDSGGSGAAQPTVTTLQAAASTPSTDDASALQAHKPAQSFAQLLEQL